jgi:hypothetical protein
LNHIDKRPKNELVYKTYSSWTIYDSKTTIFFSTTTFQWRSRVETQEPGTVKSKLQRLDFPIPTTELKDPLIQTSRQMMALPPRHLSIPEGHEPSTTVGTAHMVHLQGCGRWVESMGETPSSTTT